jgi:hypothetical protein
VALRMPASPTSERGVFLLVLSDVACRASQAASTLRIYNQRVASPDLCKIPDGHGPAPGVWIADEKIVPYNGPGKLDRS